MSRAMQMSRWVEIVFSLTVSLAFCAASTAQDDAVAELSAEERQQLAVAKRFVGVLEKTPRRGTALDRVYGHHVEFGTLDSYLGELRERVAKKPDDGAGWMLLGLFEAHRGEDAAAAEAFKRAEELRKSDALASYYLGQSLLLVGQGDEAVKAFERAIDKKPQRGDLMEIFQQLGRVHQRAQRTAEALAVWERLEGLFPSDPRVQEQIAVTLMEEGEHAEALRRYEKLAELVDDDYRKTMFRIQAADLRILQGEKEAGLANMEGLLADLNPESWLFRDVRRRVEQVFLRTGDQDGLVKYYERWLAAHPEDVDGMTRVARFLASSARVPEAAVWMEKAIKLAPKRIELRKAFIDQLVDEQRFAEAIKQYALLVESAPGNADHLRDWGKLVLRDKEQPQEARTKEATRIWKLILAARPDDAPTIAQVADLFRQANLTDEALALYRRAVELAPEDPQYREYLGEYYHILKRPEEALATWRAIAEKKRRTAANVARLAEIFNSFGFIEQAVAQIADACRLDPKDFSLQLQGADYHARGGKFDEALAFVEAARKLAETDDERDATIAQRIEIFQLSTRLDDEIEKLAGDLEKRAEAKAEEWLLLARYCEAGRRWTEATEAIEKSLAKDSKSIPALTASARIAEQSGDFARAADMNRKLADADRRSRGDHLTNVARLEAQLGRGEEALKAGRELLVSAPGNTENHQFYAQLCFRLGKSDEGLETLRKAVRIDPTESNLITALGAALSEQFRTDEAIEVYWRAFEKCEELEDKTAMTVKLTELYLQSNQLDKLIERFERDRREDDKRREMTICLAQAHQSSGDLGAARQELESLLGEDTRDTVLLQQLSKLCEGASDLDGAIEYQRQLAAAAPGHESAMRLATLLQRRGDRDEATEIFVGLTRREEDPVKLLRILDGLIVQGGFESVLAIVEPILNNQRDDWELLYLEGLAWNGLEKRDEAAARFERLLSLTHPHDALGIVASDKFKQAQAKARSENLRGNPTQAPKRQSPFEMLAQSSQVRMAVGLDPAERYSSQPMRIWTPEAFGVARMAAYGWLIKYAEEAAIATTAAATDPTSAATNASGESPVIAALAERAKAAGASRETIYDWLYVEQIRGHYASIHQISKELVKQDDAEARKFFLSSLRLRAVDGAGAYRPSGSPAQVPALADDEIELMLDCYTKLKGEEKNADLSALASGQIVYDTNGQAYIRVGNSYVPIGSTANQFLAIVIEELKRSGREEHAYRLLDERVAEAKTAAELVYAMDLSFTNEKLDKLPELLAKWSAAAKIEAAKPPSRAAPAMGARGAAPAGLARASNLLMRWMGHLAPEEEHAEILKILDAGLDLAVAEGRQRAANTSRRARAAAPTTYYNSGYQWMYGKEHQYAEVAYPPANSYVDSSTLTLLRQAFEVFRRNDVLSDLPKHLRERLAKADPPSQVYEQLMLGYVLWWSEEQDEAVEQLRAAAERLTDDPRMRLEMAALYEARGEFDEALALVDSIAPRDQKLLQQRELTALQLAERLGDVDRARQAAERLFGLRLDSGAQLGLVDRMRRLGLEDLSEAITARVQRQSGNQTSSQASLMMLYLGQGKLDLAKQIAHSIVQRGNAAASATSTYQNPRYRQNQDESRVQAINVLQQTGALPEMIARLEQQLAKSPSSSRHYTQLIELYQATNAVDKANELMQKAVAANPADAALRYQVAMQLHRSGKVNEACDHYLALIKVRPDWVFDDFYQVRQIFQSAKRMVDLVKTLESMNLKTMRQPYYVINVASELMRDEKTTDMAIGLIERVVEDLPAYRSQIVHQFGDSRLWKNPRVYAIGKRGLIPSKDDVAADPWFGAGNLYTYHQDGRAEGMFHRVYTAVRGTDNGKDLRTAIEAALRESPSWRGGEFLIAFMDMQDGNELAAKARLQAMFADKALIEKTPPTAAWMIGQELDRFEDTQPLAIELLQRATFSQEYNNQISYSPVARLAKLHADAGRKEEARETILKAMRGVGNQNYDAGYQAYLKLQNRQWAGQKLRELGLPIDALGLMYEIVGDSKAIEAYVRYDGGSPDQIRARLNAELLRALEEVDETNAAEAMERLLVVDEKSAAKGKPAFELSLTVPEATSLGSQPIESVMLKMLQSFVPSESLRERASARLRQLQSDRPDDLSIAIAWAAIDMAANSKDQVTEPPASLRNLEGLLARQPLPEFSSARRPNSRERREALQSAPLWLVARECLARESTRDIGQRLAARAVAGARLQVEMKTAVAILYDWGKRALDAGDREQAEAKWSELLELATERPTPKAARKEEAAPAQPAAPAKRSTTRRETRVDRFSFVAYWQPPTPAAPRVDPPLTNSQFRTAIEIAVAAADNAMPALSRKAVREAMRGGIFVADPQPTQAANQAVRRSGYIGTVDQGASAGSEAEVAAALERVIGKWTGDAYPPAEVYELLLPIVLPPARTDQVMLYPNSALLSSGRAQSLAGTLVEWATKANRLGDLATQVKARRQSAQPKAPAILAALVIETQIALAENRTADAQSLLAEVDAAISGEGAAPDQPTLACHAALPAADRPELKDAAMTLLQKAIGGLTVNSTQAARRRDQQSQLAVSSLAVRVNRHVGDAAKTKDFYERYLAGRQTLYARYSGDSALYQQSQDLAAVAEAAAKSRAPAAALDYLGRAVDIVTTNYGRSSSALALAVICREMDKLPAAERYEAWRAWTLPRETRQSVRMVVERSSSTPIPKRFLEASMPVVDPSGDALLCNFTKLVDVAEEIGKLEELRDEASSAAGKHASAKVLWMLALCRLKQHEPALGEWIGGVAERLKAQKPNEYGYNQPTDYWSDYLVFRECMKSEELRKAYGAGKEALIKGYREQGRDDFVAMVEAEFARGPAQAARQDENASSPLAYWRPAAALGQRAKPKWRAAEESLAHRAGGGASHLYFKYPLAGDFTFSFDTYRLGYEAIEAGFGGLIVRTMHGSSTFAPTSGHENQVGPGGAFTGLRDGFNRAEIRAQSGVLRFAVNGAVVYEEPASATSPWLMLSVAGQRNVGARNLRLSGEPSIPREVSLIVGDRLDGWNCSYLSETQPSKRLMKLVARDDNDIVRHYQMQEPKDYDWLAKDGELLGKARVEFGPDAQSWIYYHRPMQDGETVRYEFYHAPGSSVAFPSIGQIALMVLPEGVCEHWIVQPTWDGVVQEVEPTNRVAVAANRRGPAATALKENAWNSAEVKLRGAAAIFSLNGETIYELPLEADNSRTFGFYRQRAQGCQLKNIVLTGPWPEKLAPDISGNLLAAASSTNGDEAKLPPELATEFLQEFRAADIVRLAASQSDEEAYKTLGDWVLPSPARDFCRLYFERRPIANGDPRGVSESSLLCPAVDLARVSKRLGKLRELSQLVAGASAASDAAKRSQTAMLSLLAIEAGQNDEAESRLAELYTALANGLPKETPRGERFPVFVAAWRAMQEPALRFAALDLATKLQSLERDEKTYSGDDDWRTQVEGLAADAERALAGDPKSSLAQWREVPYCKSELRGKGFRPGSWRTVRGAAQHSPGETWSQLYFQSPLVGKFEIHAERALHGWREVAIAYGMHSTDPRYDFKAKRVATLMRPTREMEGELAIPHPDWVAKTRIVVDGTKVTTYINDVYLHEENFPAAPDPWIVLQAYTPGYASRVRDLRIVGQPTIPDSIDLTSIAGLAGWRADNYPEQLIAGGSSQDTMYASWRTAGQEIVGEMPAYYFGKPRESLLAYQRPMLEDGVIEFESYYDPGKIEVHPALGRTAFLLSPEGVKIHRLTDGAWESTGLPADNEAPLEGASDTVPLKAKEWNRIRLETAGDRVTLSVNGEQVAAAPIEESVRERFFGLFRYGDRTRSRVRKVIYSGQWPRELPPLENQELAYPAAGAFSEGELKGALQEFDLSRPLAEYVSAGLAAFGPAERISTSDKGTRLELAAATGPEMWPGLSLKQPIAGDFDATLAFEQLALTPVKEGWGNGFSFKIVFDAPERWAEVGVYLDGTGQPQLRSTLAHRDLSGAMAYDGRALAVTPEAGRMRMVRVGSMLHCLFAPRVDGPGEGFKLLESFAVGETPIRELKIECPGSDAVGSAAVVASKLTLTREN